MQGLPPAAAAGATVRVLASAHFPAAALVAAQLLVARLGRQLATPLACQEMGQGTAEAQARAQVKRAQVKRAWERETRA
jgi:hypothetical protein